MGGGESLSFQASELDGIVVTVGTQIDAVAQVADRLDKSRGGVPVKSN